MKARIKIDTDRTIGDIDPNLFGSFTEHLGRSIYGGIYEPTSSQADEFGFRKDVQQVMKEMGVTNVRYPGGNFVSGYHWVDGIGDKARRPKRMDLAWGGIEPNTVGTDEFLRWAARAQVEPFMCINLGTGTLEEARSWVEYCNAKPGTTWADLRAANGHPEPYRVKYWGLGNEIDGSWQMGHKNASDYGKFALEAAKMMKWTDPNIKLVAVGSSDTQSNNWIDWNKTVLGYLYGHADYIALHFYVGEWGQKPNWWKDPLYFLSRINEVEERIKITKGLIEEVKIEKKSTKPIYIAFDEFNVWYRAFNEQKLEERYDLQDALMIAQYLNTFIRNADVVKMANIAQMVNVIAPIFVENDKVWRQTTFYPFQLFAQNSKGKSLDVWVDAPRYEVAQFKNQSYLDVSASYDAQTNELVIGVVNRHPEQSIATEIISQNGRFPATITVHEIAGNNLYEQNSLANAAIKTKTKEVPAKDFTLPYNFPAHSFTMFKVALGKSK